MPRSIQSEILDHLEPTDPAAIHSRRDLQKINAIMGHSRILARALQPNIGGARLVELGAGDGTLLLKVARRLGRQRSPVSAMLVDRHPSLSGVTRSGFEAVGWRVEAMELDVFEWLRRPHRERFDVTIANLFLHHFHESELTDLFRRVSEQTWRFFACEPRRSRSALTAASLLRFLGCNAVTRHDACISVRAGFRDRELSALWPRESRWRLAERRDGPFTHSLVAEYEA